MDFRVDEGICGSSTIVISDLSGGFARPCNSFRADLTQEDGIAQQETCDVGQGEGAAASHETRFCGLSGSEADGAATSGKPLAAGIRGSRGICSPASERRCCTSGLAGSWLCPLPGQR